MQNNQQSDKEEKNEEFLGNGMKYLDYLDNNNPELKEKTREEKVMYIILGLLNNNLNRDSIVEQLKDIPETPIYLEKLELALAQLSGGDK
jgi:hypothetical protein